MYNQIVAIKARFFFSSKQNPDRAPIINLFLIIEVYLGYGLRSAARPVWPAFSVLGTGAKVKDYHNKRQHSDAESDE
jgi:hypothetical protein